MTKPNYQKATFLLSVAALQQLPDDQGAEVAFIGRSNAGKSSVLNRVTQNKHLARVSKTPGRTQLINVFTLDADRRLMDLPGYGYAKVPLSVKQHWDPLIDQYLQSRHSLRGLILIMDSRHPLQPLDHSILAWASECDIAVHIVLNKIDKLKLNQIKQLERMMPPALEKYQNAVSFQMFSALKNTGLEGLQKKLDEWFIL